MFEDPAGIPRALFWGASGFYLLFLVVTAVAFRGGVLRRSGRAAAIAFAAGAGVTVALWFPLRPAFDSWAWPYAFTAYLWWTLPLGAAAAAVWTIMFRSRYGPVSRST